MIRLFQILLMAGIAITQLPVLGMQIFAKRAAQAMVKKINRPSLLQQTYNRDQYNNRHKYNHSKKESSKFNFDWKKFTYHSSFKNLLSLSTLAASINLAASYGQNNSDDDQLQKEKLLSLLNDACDDNYSILQARAIRLIQNNPEWVAQQLIIIFNNYDKVKQLIWLLKNHECCTTLINKALTKNYELVVQQPYFKDFFQAILTLNHLYKEIPELKDLKTKLIKHYFLQKAQENEIADCKYSPTMAHLINSDVHTALSEYITDEQLSLLAKKVIFKEIELNKQGYFTFVHGQRWKYQLAEEWFTKLWQLSQGQNIQDFVFAHIKSLPSDIESERETRERILKTLKVLHQSKSITLSEITKIASNTQLLEDTKRLLFMNAGLFYNERNPGSNTAAYVQYNINVHTLIFSLEHIFKLHRIEHLYNAYKKELDTLEMEHQQLSKYGNLLLIAVPKEKINDAAFIAYPSGVLKKQVTINGIGQTSDLNLILPTLQSDPTKIREFDRNEFCLLMTDDKQGGLNPKSGIKFFQFNTVEQKQWEEFKAKEQALFNKIAQDIRLEKLEEHRKKADEKYTKFKRETAEHANAHMQELYFASQLADK